MQIFLYQLLLLIVSDFVGRRGASLEDVASAPVVFSFLS